MAGSRRAPGTPRGRNGRPTGRFRPPCNATHRGGTMARGGRCHSPPPAANPREEGAAPPSPGARWRARARRSRSGGSRRRTPRGSIRGKTACPGSAPCGGHIEEPVPQASEGLSRIANHLDDVREADRFADVEPEDLVIERVALAGNLDRVRSVPNDPRMVPAVGAVDHVVVDSDWLV